MSPCTDHTGWAVGTQGPISRSRESPCLPSPGGTTKTEAECGSPETKATTSVGSAAKAQCVKANDTIRMHKKTFGRKSAWVRDPGATELCARHSGNLVIAA